MRTTKAHVGILIFAALAVILVQKQLYWMANPLFSPASVFLEQHADLPIMTARKRKLLIHLGPHKTATTTVQAGLCRNVPWDSSDWQYPLCKECTFDCCAQHKLPLKLMGPSFSPTDACFDDQVLNSTKNIVVSSEIFDQLNAEHFSRLREHVSDRYEVHAVLFHRDKVDHLESSYYQHAWEHADFSMTMRQFLDYMTTVRSEKSFGFQFQPLVKTIVKHLLGGDASRLTVVAYHKVDPFQAVIDLMDDPKMVIEERSLKDNKSAKKEVFQLWPFLWKKRHHLFTGTQKEFEALFKCVVKKIENDDIIERDYVSKCEVSSVLQDISRRDRDFCLWFGFSKSKFDCDDLLMKKKYLCFLQEDSLSDNLIERINQIASDCALPAAA